MTSIKNIILLSSALLIIVSSTQAQPEQNPTTLEQRRLSRESDVIMLREYFDLITSGNLESAYYLWTDACRARSDKFNIHYLNIPLKVDCNSPVVRDLETMRYFLDPPAKLQMRLTPSIYSKLEYRANVDGNEVGQDYYSVFLNGFNWLIYPQDYYCRDFEKIQTKYFDIRYNPNLKEYLNDDVLNAADNYIEAMADSLNLGDEKLKQIETEKITYFLCESDESIKEITGHMIKGTFDLPSNDIISAFFPHYHELDHLLINYKLQELPLFTLPLFREGSAVKYGGRWGKSPASLLALAGYLYKENVFEFDSILTMNGFNKFAGADLAYPVAGLFNSFLIDKIGIEKYLNLYREMSGNFDTVNSIKAEDIMLKITESAGYDSWQNLKEDFTKYIDKAIEKNSGLTAGNPEKKGKLIVDKPEFQVYDCGDWYAVVVSPTEGKPEGNILFDHDLKLSGMKSALFNEQYRGDRQFEGYRYGIRYDTNEVGIYDYATNYLMAKYIWGITPSENYYHEDENKLYFTFKKDITDVPFDKFDDYTLLPQ